MNKGMRVRLDTSDSEEGARAAKASARTDRTAAPPPPTLSEKDLAVYRTLTRRQKRSVRRTMIRAPKPGMALATSECRCGKAFAARTSRLAIKGRQDHEREAHA